LCALRGARGNPLQTQKQKTEMTQTSIHITAAKASSEAHNLREKFLDYVKPELSPKNEFFSVCSISERLQEVKDLCKQLTGRKMQDKATPIREGVIVIDEHTTMKQIQDFGKACEAKWGIKLIQAYIHRDEGAKDKNGEWKSNLHAHVIFDWVDHNTGKSVKMNKQDMCEMQTLLADVLQLERGVTSDVKHLNAVQYKVQTQTERLTETAKETYVAEQNLNKVKQEVQEVKTNFAEIDKSRDSLKAEAGTARVEVVKLRNEINSLQKQIEVLQNEVSPLQENLREKIKSPIESIRLKSELAQAHIETAQAQEVASTATETARAEAKQETAHDTISLKQQVRTLTSEAQEAKTEAKTAKAQVKQAVQAVTTLKQQVHTLTSEAQEAKTEAKTAKAENGFLRLILTPFKKFLLDVGFKAQQVFELYKHRHTDLQEGQKLTYKGQTHTAKEGDFAHLTTDKNNKINGIEINNQSFIKLEDTTQAPQQPVKAQQATTPQQPVKTEQARQEEPVKAQQATTPQQPVKTEQARQEEPVKAQQATAPQQPVKTEQARQEEPVKAQQATTPQQPVKTQQAEQPAQPVKTQQAEQASPQTHRNEPTNAQKNEKVTNYHPAPENATDAKETAKNGTQEEQHKHTATAGGAETHEEQHKHTAPETDEPKHDSKEETKAPHHDDATHTHTQKRRGMHL
jgi:uncharacterized coiled-coil DUF342 family protein